MAWLNWLKGKKSSTAVPAALPAGTAGAAGVQNIDSVRFSNSRKGHSQPPDALSASNQRLEQRRTERNTKRELLFQVVRESMVRVGVLSTAFKFKVLSLDQRGRSFLVMIELSSQFGGEADKLAEIEKMISQSAKTRFDIMVQAVYWRYFNPNAAAQSGARHSSPAPLRAATSAPAPLLGTHNAPISRPAPLYSMGDVGLPVPQASRAAVASAQAPNWGTNNLAPPASAKAHDALDDDEVLAFRRALAAGVAATGVHETPGGAAAAPKIYVKPAAPDPAADKLLLTGYEDTEMVDEDPPMLSGTQYGELR